MKSFLVFTRVGPVLVLSRFDSVKEPALLNRLSAYGKFVAHELPIEAVKSCYSAHYEHILNDPKQSDDFRVLDTDGERIFTNVSFQVLGPPAYHEPGQALRCYPV